jgi:hypothetical protein
MYKSPAEIIMGFDIDACCGLLPSPFIFPIRLLLTFASVLYDGTSVWVLPRARRAIVTGLNYVDMSSFFSFSVSLRWV